MQRLHRYSDGSAGIGLAGGGVSLLRRLATDRFSLHALVFERIAFIDRAVDSREERAQAKAISTREILSAQDDPADSYVRITSSYQSESRRD